MQVNFFKHGDKTVTLKGLRCIQEIHSNPAGGQPYRDAGVITYDDGYKIETSLEFAQELAAFVTTAADDED
jgi:hypothetical protein